MVIASYYYHGIMIYPEYRPLLLLECTKVVISFRVIKRMTCHKMSTLHGNLFSCDMTSFRLPILSVGTLIQLKHLQKYK